MNNSPSIVFYADDDPDDLMLFEEAVSSFQVRPELFPNGHSILRALEHTVPSMIFLDINMPGKSGLEVLTEIRANPYLKDIPIVILSTAGDRHTIETTMRLGANSYVVKAANLKVFREALSRVIATHWQLNRISQDCSDSLSN